MRVLKFGGSSVGSPERIEQVISILNSYFEHNVEIAVVFSAFQGVTDGLISLAKQAVARDEAYNGTLQHLRRRHIEAVESLVKKEELVVKTSETVTQMFNQLKDLLHGVYLLKELTPRIMDNILSFGERLSCFIITKALTSRGVDAEYLDSSNLIRTDSNFSNARVNFSVTNKNITEYFAKHKAIQIITGFIASNDDGVITTLGRGGSDYTASIYGAALDAEEIEIWTDVNGIMTADPRKVKSAKSLKAVTYQEAMEMSHFGAKVIYPPTMQPALAKNIKIRIKNTFEPEFRGTVILEKEKSISFNAKGISSIESVAILRVEGSALVGNEKVTSRLFDALASAEVPVMMLTQGSSGLSICFAVMPQFAAIAKKTIEKEFKHELADGLVKEINVMSDLSMVAVVGEDMANVTGLSGKVFQSLGKNGISLIAIAQGSSERNISFVIKNSQLTKALNTLHNTLFLSNEKELNLFLVGPGLVGKALIDYINKRIDFVSDKLHTKIKIIGVMNSKKMLFDENGISHSGWKTALEASDKKSDIKEFIATMDKMNKANSIFVDCTANKTAVPYYQDILNASISITTPNKIANTESYENYLALKTAAIKNNVQFRYGTNVGAGLPIINNLNDMIASGEEVLKIEGILSGTLSYLFNNFKRGEKFSDLVKSAKNSGYTEPDPRDDLNGLDVARKLLILIRETGEPFELSDIEVENLVPEKARNVDSVSEFFDILEKEDSQFEKRIASADKAGKVLRYIAKYEGGKATVSLQEVGPEHPFYNLTSNDNIAALTTTNYNEQPLTIRGRGAGAEFTAAGIFADILRINNYLS